MKRWKEELEKDIKSQKNINIIITLTILWVVCQIALLVLK